MANVQGEDYSNLRKFYFLLEAAITPDLYHT